MSGEPEAEQSGGDADGDVEDDNERAAKVAQKKKDHEAGERGTEDALLKKIAQGALDPGALVELEGNVNVLGAGGFEFCEVGFDEAHHRESRRVAALGHGHVHRAPPVHEGDAREQVAAVAHLGDVPQEDASLGRHSQRDRCEVLDVFDDRIGGDDGKGIWGREISTGADRVGSRDRSHDLIRREGISPESIGFHRDEDCAGTAAEGGWRGNTGQRGKKRAHHVQSGVLHLADGAVGVVRRKDQVPDGYTARVEAGDEGSRSARRHKGPGPVHVGDRFRHRVAHVRSRMELELHDGGALDGLRFHVLDARDVEEVVLVIIREVPLHLQGIHPAKRLGHVNGRDTQRGKNVACHLLGRAPGAEEDSKDDHQNGPGAAER